MSVHSLYLSKSQKVAFLYRATFGSTLDDVTHLQTIGVQQWFEEQSQLPPSYHLPVVQQATALANLDKPNSTIRTGAWYQHALTAPDQLRQRMAYALSQILVISQQGLGNRHDEIAAYYDLLVQHSLGNFKDLLKDVTTNPMMGRYLTLRGSRKANPKKNSFPDENYAREVMQLFTLGLWRLNNRGEALLDSNGQKIPTYQQDDVQELARVLTGWTGGSLHVPMYGKEKFHDYDEKVVLGQTFPAGQNTQQDLEQAIEVLFNHPNTPPFIANLLIKRFVTSNPRPEYIERVAQTFINNGMGVRGDLKATLFAILTDEDALNSIGSQSNQSPLQQHNHFGLIKEPILMITNQAKALGMSTIGDYWRDFMSSSRTLGQSPLNSETVFNFYLPDFMPQGILEERGLTSPEASLLTTYQMQMIHNKIVQNIESHKNKKSTQWRYDITPFLAVHQDPDAYTQLINERIFLGLMPARVHQQIVEALTLHIPLKQDLRRVKTTLYIAFTAPEFFTQEALA
ncbi:TPA: DUF1800 domain-containing protein [Photobacterium damselae]